MARYHVYTVMNSLSYLADGYRVDIPGTITPDMIDWESINKRFDKVVLKRYRWFDYATEPPKPHLRTTLSGKRFKKIAYKDRDRDYFSQQGKQLDAVHRTEPKTTFRDVKPDYVFEPALCRACPRVTVNVGDLTIKEVNECLDVLGKAGLRPVYDVMTATISYKGE